MKFMNCCLSRHIVKYANKTKNFFLECVTIAVKPGGYKELTSIHTNRFIHAFH